MKKLIIALTLLLLGLLSSGAVAHAARKPTQISPTLIAHWQLGEGTGTIAMDSSGNDYNGTITNPIWSSDVPPIPGAGSYSLEFDRTTYIDTAAFDINDDFTIGFWMKTSETNGQAFIAKHAADDSLQFLLSMDRSLLQVHIGNAFDEVFTPYNPQWQHILLVGKAHATGTTIDLYRNGIPQYTYEFPNRIGDVAGGKPWTIGRMFGSNYAFEGHMADVRIYDGALSENEIAALTAGFATSCPVPSATYADVDAALSNNTCELIDIAAGEHLVSYHALTRGVIVNGAGRDQTVLKVKPGSYRMATIQKPAVFKNMTLRDGGQVPDDSGLAPNGALFRIDAGSQVTLDNVLVTNNHSSFDGGAIDNQGSLTVLSSKFTDNCGGGYYLPSSTFSGGAIRNEGALTIQDTVFSGNCMLAAVQGNMGGAIANSGTLTILNTLFDDNNALKGGALYNEGSAVIQGVTMTRNRGGFGSAIFNAGSLQADNSTISGNSVYSETGEKRTIIHQQNSEAAMILIHATVADNEPAGLIALNIDDGSLSIHNTLVARNGTANCLIETTGPIMSTGNMSDDANCQAFIISDAIKLEQLADNGGPTPTQAIPADSAAVDAGDPAWCTAIDQRGVNRRAGQCDIGAYEVEPSAGNNTLFLPLLLNN